MKKLDSGQIVTLLANVGVIAGIVFLALEIQQNNALLSAQARTSRVEIQTNFQGTVYENAELAEIITRASANDELTEAEELRLRWLGQRLLTSLQFVFGEYQQGMIDEDAISTAQWRMAFHEQIPRMEDTWSVFRDGLNPEFVQWMDENIVNER